MFLDVSYESIGTTGRVLVHYYESMKLVVHYESIKRDPKIIGIYECRCDERLQTKTKEFTRLPYTGLVLELEHLKIETKKRKLI